KLTQRVKDELGITRYKPIQYDKLQAMVEAKKLYSEEIEHKSQAGHFSHSHTYVSKSK
ncbi:coiled-coil domain-containing protein 148, partial [Tachysurus ichikawai]